MNDLMMVCGAFDEAMMVLLQEARHTGRFAVCSDGDRPARADLVRPTTAAARARRAGSPGPGAKRVVPQHAGRAPGPGSPAYRRRVRVPV